jgi:hypothetical protein
MPRFCTGGYLVKSGFILFLFGSGPLLFGSCSSDAPTTAPSSTVTAARSVPSAADSVKLAAVVPTITPRPVEAPPKVVKLPHGVTLKLGRPEEFADQTPPLTLYSYLQVLHGGRVVYEDSTHEFDVAQRPYPTTFTAGAGAAVLLLESNNRDLNELLRLQIRNGQATVTDTLPAFTNGPTQLDDDAPLELAGMMTSNETWEEAGQEYTTYNPIRYYELTPAGPVFDAKLTARKARTIYGQFLGFCYRERPAMPASTKKRYGAELARIAAKAKQR